MTVTPRSSSRLNWVKQFRVSQPFIPYLFLLPALLALGISVFWPALQAFYFSFTTFGVDLTASPQWVGLDNVHKLLRDKVFWLTIRNTLLYLVGVVPVLTLAPLGLAILVNRSLKMGYLTKCCRSQGYCSKVSHG